MNMRALMLQPGGALNSYTGVYSNDPWIDTIMVDYFDTKGAYSGDSDKSWAVTELADWLQTGGYAYTTFGPAGSDEDEADFFILLMHDGNTSANTISKSGATLRHDIGDTTYNQNNVPVHVFDNNERWVISSTDGFSSTSSLSLISCNIINNQYWNVELSLNILLRLSSNSNLTGFVNLVSNLFSDLRFNSCNLTGNLTLSNIIITGILDLNSNSNLTGITFGTTLNTLSIFRAYSCGLSGNIDFTNVKFTGECRFYNNPSLTGITFGNNASTITSLEFYSCDITGDVDFKDLTFNGTFLGYSNPNLTGCDFSSCSGTVNNFQLGYCGIVGNLNTSTIDINSTYLIYNNPLLTGFTLSGTSVNMSSFRFFSCNITGNQDISSVSCTSRIYGYSNPLLTGLTISSTTFTTTTVSVLFNSCGLTISEVDEQFSVANTFYSSNAPTSDLNINTSGGTNGVPTGGASNTDITNLASVYTTAGYLFTAIINT